MKFSPVCSGSSKTLFKRRVLAPVTGALVLSIVFSSSASGATDLATALTTSGTSISGLDSNGYLFGSFELTSNLILTKTDNFYSDYSYMLTSSDSDLNETIIDNDGNLETVFSSFSGTLNGNGFTISNLDVPLFSELAAATISNINLTTDENGINGTGPTGILARTTTTLLDSDPEAPLRTTLIDEVHVSGIVTSSYDYTGGLVGQNYYGIISNSSNSAEISSSGSYVGGIAGSDESGTLNNTLNSGSISSSGMRWVGGLIGNGQNSSIENSDSSGEVRGNFGVGGLIGNLFEGQITDSNSTGNVKGNINVGGLIGGSESSQISNSTFDAVVSGLDESPLSNGYAGGIIGNDFNSSITNVIAKGEVKGSDRTGGIIGAGWDSVITDSVFSGNVIGGTDAGGISGYQDEDSIISRVAFEGTISGDSRVGGLIGNNEGALKNSISFGEVTGTGINIGGAVGIATSNSVIEGVISTGNVFGDSYVGGLVGSNFGSIANSIATGDVGGSESTSSVGGLVGSSGYGSIENSFATGDVIAENASVVGGLIGDSYGTSVINSKASGEVHGASSVGGLIGYSNSDTITSSTASGKVIGTTWIGGLIGTSYDTDVLNSLTSGDIGDTASSSKVGGLIGYAIFGSIENSLSTRNVSADNANKVGGLTGHSESISIINSQANGNVSGSFSVGGLSGHSSYDFILDSKAIGNVAGYQTVGGFIGDFDNSDVDNSASEGSISRNVEGGNYLGTFLGTKAFGMITRSASISEQHEIEPTFPYVGNDEDWVPGTIEDYDSIGLSSELTPVTLPTSALTALNFKLQNPAWDINQYINGGKPYLLALLDSDFYSDTTPDPVDPTDPTDGGSNSNNGRISLAEIEKREKSERKILESLKSDVKKIEVEDFKSAGINGVTESSLPIVVELLAELEIETFEASTVQKVVQIAGAISRIVSTDQGKTISFIDLKRVGVTAIEYSELKDFSKFLALIPADKKNTIKEIQLLVAEFKKDREAAGKAREAKKEATRIAREKNLQLVLNMFKK
jgi:hypothetical protein